MSIIVTEVPYIDAVPVYPTCDNDCAWCGFTREYIITQPMMDMHVSVHVDADLDGVVKAFSHDEQRMVAVNGWMWDWELLDGKY